MLKWACKPATKLSSGVRTTIDMSKPFGDTSIKNILVNVTLWAVMAIGVVIASFGAENHRSIVIAIVFSAFMFLTLYNVNEIKKSNKKKRNIK